MSRLSNALEAQLAQIDDRAAKLEADHLTQRAALQQRREAIVRLRAALRPDIETFLSLLDAAGIDFEGNSDANQRRLSSS